MMKMAITTSVPCRLHREQEEQGPVTLSCLGKSHPSRRGTAAVHRQGTAQGPPRRHHPDPHAQPAGQKPQRSPANRGEELPPFHAMATLPQTHSPDLQIIQGQAGTRLVHWVVGDRDACRKAQEETQERESWPRTEIWSPACLVLALGGTTGFLPSAQQELSCLKQPSTSRPSPPSPAGTVRPWTRRKPTGLQAALWDVLPQPRPQRDLPSPDHVAKACDPPAPMGHWPAGSKVGKLHFRAWLDHALTLFPTCFCPPTPPGPHRRQQGCLCSWASWLAGWRC